MPDSRWGWAARSRSTPFGGSCTPRSFGRGSYSGRCTWRMCYRQRWPRSSNARTRLPGGLEVGSNKIIAWDTPIRWTKSFPVSPTFPARTSDWAWCSCPWYEHDLQPWNPLEIAVGCDNGQVLLQGRGSDQSIDIAD